MGGGKAGCLSSLSGTGPYLLTNILSWLSIFRDWQSPHRQHDSAELVAHLLKLASPQAFVESGRPDISALQFRSTMKAPFFNHSGSKGTIRSCKPILTGGKPRPLFMPLFIRSMRWSCSCIVSIGIERVLLSSCLLFVCGLGTQLPYHASYQGRM